MTRRRTATALTTALALSALAACGDTSTGDDTKPSTPASSSATATDGPAGDSAAFKQAESYYKRWLAMEPTTNRPLPAAATQVATKHAIGEANKGTKLLWGKRSDPQYNLTKVVGHDTLLGAKGLERRLNAAADSFTLTLHICQKPQQKLLSAKGTSLRMPPNGNPSGIVLFRSPDGGTTWLIDDTSGIKQGTACSAQDPTDMTEVKQPWDKKSAPASPSSR